MTAAEAVTVDGYVVYRAYNADGELLYIGHTGNLASRWRAHRHTAPWWSETAQLTTTPAATKAEAVEMERLAIQAERPRHNVQLAVGSRQLIVNFRVPAEVKSKATQRAEREGINLTDALRDFLTEWANAPE